jgi:hypothetical protein
VADEFETYEGIIGVIVQGVLGEIGRRGRESKEEREIIDAPGVATLSYTRSVGFTFAGAMSGDLAGSNRELE